jgi:hypothetical protein
MENTAVGDSYVQATCGRWNGLRGIVECVTPFYIKFQEENGGGLTQVSKKYVEKKPNTVIVGNDFGFTLAVMFS